MSELKAMLWTGGDAPNKEAKLTVSPTGGPRNMQFAAYWQPGYCGCADCRPCQGFGATEEEAIADYWAMWEGRREENFERMEQDYHDSRAGTR